MEKSDNLEDEFDPPYKDQTSGFPISDLKTKSSHTLFSKSKEQLIQIIKDLAQKKRPASDMASFQHHNQIKNSYLPLTHHLQTLNVNETGDFDQNDEQEIIAEAKKKKNIFTTIMIWMSWFFHTASLGQHRTKFYYKGK